MSEEHNSQPSTSSTDSERLIYINRNGGVVLLRAGHQYSKKKEYANGWSLWRCVKWRQNCSGSVNVKENNISKEIHHQCDPSEMDNVIAKKLHECREKVLSSSFSPIPNIYNNVKSEFNESGLDLVQKLPSFSNIKTALYAARNKEACISKIQCKLAKEVVIPSQFKDFVLGDHYDETSDIRIIIFADVNILKHIKHIKMYLSDGTFDCCPTPFLQMYSIHGDLGSDEEYTRIVPLLYSLVNKKNEDTYKTLFQLIKNLIPEWEPMQYLTDFEQAAMNAIKTIFPSVKVKGCYFHFTHNVWKKAKALNLTKNKRLRKHIALSSLLPLLPREHISDGWCYIMEDSPDSVEIQTFNDYMVTQWLEDERFVDTWCAYNQRHRTTNAVEAWHKKVNSSLPKSPNLYQLLKVLIEDAKLQTVKINEYYVEISNPKRRLTKDIVTDKWYKHVTDQLLTGQITVGHCLEKLRL
jgi:hypothetical protein